MPWDPFVAAAPPETNDAPVRSSGRRPARIHRLGPFNESPPGTSRHRDGSVTFLDFGLVKRWTPAEGAAGTDLDAIVVHHDPERVIADRSTPTFSRPATGSTRPRFDYVRSSIRRTWSTSPPSPETRYVKRSPGSSTSMDPTPP